MNTTRAPPPSGASSAVASTANSSGNAPEHPISLKVMRLRKSEFSFTFPIQCEAADMLSNTNLSHVPPHYHHEINDDDDLSLQSLGLSDKMMLPSNFGQIFVGETFNCYISMHNNSYRDIKNVAVKSELMINTQRYSLLDLGNSPIPVFAPGTNNDYVVEQPLTETGTYILVCTVLYDAPILPSDAASTSTQGLASGSSPSSTSAPYASSQTTFEQRSFRKIFKFPVMNPLIVRAMNIYNVKERYFLNFELQNAIGQPLFVEGVKLDQTIGFTTLNHSTHSQGGVFDQVMSVDEVRKFLFELVPKSGKRLGQSITLGKIELQWRTTLGEMGKVATNTIQHKGSARPDIDVVVEEIVGITGAGTVSTETEFVLKCRVYNYGIGSMTSQPPPGQSVPLAPAPVPTLALRMNLDKSSPLVLSGPSVRTIGELPPGTNKPVEISLFALRPGVHTIGGPTSGITVKDANTNAIYPVGVLCTIVVVQPHQPSLSPRGTN